MRRIDRIFALAGAGALGACAPAIRPIIPTPTPVPATVHEGPTRPGTIARAPLPPVNPALPPVPQVAGPLDIRVVYPPENAIIGSRDSNFVIGSVGNGEAGLTINGALVPVWPNGAFMAWIPNPSRDAQSYEMVAFTQTDTARRRYRIRTRDAQPPSPSTPPRVVKVDPAERYILGNDSLAEAVNDTDQVIIGRPTPTGTYRWFLFPGTTVSVIEFVNDMAHVRLDAKQEAWIARADLRRASSNGGGDVHVTGQPELVYGREWVDLRVPVDAPPAYLVEEDDQRLTLTLYGTTGEGLSSLRVHDSAELSGVETTMRNDRVAFRVDLLRPVYGYLAFYEHGVLTLRVRYAPRVDAAEPLRGLTIAIDAGHPPGGATGPTGLYEPIATLAIAEKVEAMLRERGATVVMTRTSAAPLALGDRPIMARRANANALVSIHLNALPDGMNPFRTSGTGTYYFHPHAQRFASFMQQSLVPALGLRDLGTFRENLALCRPTWMPAVLTEGLFVIVPDQEAAIRTPEYQAAYARGIVDGLQHYFATFAR